MTNFIFITGNQNKADYLAKWLGSPIAHQKLDLDEIQSLNLRDVVEHKAKQAYELVKKPVLVEDVALTFTAMSHLPGTFIKWFLEDLGTDGLCTLADGLEHRGAEGMIEYALYDGNAMHFFAGSGRGTIAPKPRGNFGFGWNPIFIPEGSTKTYAEMTDDEVRPFSHRAHAVEKLKAFLQST